MNRKNFYTAVILLAFLTIGIQPAFADIYIPEDESVGTWDENNQIYTLTSDVSDTIILSNPNVDFGPGGSGGVEGDRITFDGGGYTVSAPTSPPPNYYGISFNQDDTSKNGFITIQNLNITDCDVGINIQSATRINVIDTDISSCHYGINIGIAGTCIIRDNTISDCTEYGIELNGAIDNTIYNNNFLNRAGFQAHVFGNSSGNVFYLDLPIGGNFWSDWTEPDDEEPYGIVDDAYPNIDVDDPPYEILDIYPLAPTPETKLEELIAKVETINGENGINNALDSKLENALDALTAKNAGQRQDAVNKMEAFINAVEAQSGNKIPVEVAAILIADAQYIIDLILAE